MSIAPKLARSPGRKVWLVSALLLLLFSDRLKGQDAGASKPPPSTSELFERSLQVALEALNFYGAYDDPPALRRVAEIGYRIAAASGFSQVPITFFLIDMPEPNAFALPGGQVFVTRGMLGLHLGDDALAALLGHEIAHVVFRHGVRMERRATLLQLLSQALVLGAMLQASQSSPGPRPGEVPDPYGLERTGSSRSDLLMGTYAASLIVSELLLRSYSREFEDEADREGQRWAALAGFCPDGARELMEVLRTRLPEPSKEYGYWRTHPYFEERVTAAEARSPELKRGEPKDTAEFRERTQRQLLELAPQGARSIPKIRSAPDRPERNLRAPQLTREQLLREAALTSWPRGAEADRLRRERWRERREAFHSRPPSHRDWGKLLAELDRELAEVTALDPTSALVATLQAERQVLEQERRDFQPRALEIWKAGVWETGFLERFLSNYPESPEAAGVALALGEAYARSGRFAESVQAFLRAQQVSGEEPLRKAAEEALRRLAPQLTDLVALGELSEAASDPELRELATERLRNLASSYTDLSSGRKFLERFPNSPLLPTVTERLYRLADNLYGEVVLYQSLGDSTRAIERIQRILNEAPDSPAAQKLLERVVLPSS
jgi:predicted Zn-dependent protease